MDIALGVFIPLVQAGLAIQAACDQVHVQRHQCVLLAIHVQDAITLIKQQVEKLQWAGDDSSCRTTLQGLEATVADCLRLTQSLGSRKFLQHLLDREQIASDIQSLHHRLDFALNSFNIVAHSSLAVSNEKREQARRADQEEIAQAAEAILRNQSLEAELSSVRHNETSNLLRSIYTHLKGEQDPATVTFLNIAANELERTSSQVREVAERKPSWLLPPTESISRLRVIGGGAFSTVYEGEWRGLAVAVKDFAPDVPTKTILKECEVWFSLRHPHVALPLRAALDATPPFIISDLAAQGNAVRFLARNPTADPIRVLLDAALGMDYLHESDILHGDLKGVNILIDAGGKALLTDFGLSQIKTKALKRRNTIGYAGGAAASQNSGTLRWMAPELLGPKPSSIAKESDVYAWAITAFELCSSSNPFPGLSEDDVVRLVKEEGARPERPANGPLASEQLWGLVEDCWTHESTARPTFADIVKRLTYISRASPQPSLRSAPSFVRSGSSFWTTTSTISTAATTIDSRSGSMSTPKFLSPTPSLSPSFSPTTSLAAPSPSFAASSTSLNLVMSPTEESDRQMFVSSPSPSPAGHRVITLQGHSDIVSSVSFNGAGDSLASVSHDKTLRIWNLRDMSKPSNEALEVLKTPLYSVAYGWRSPLVAVGLNSRQVKLFRAVGSGLVPESDVYSKLFPGNDPLDFVRSLAWQEDDLILLAGSRHSVTLWDPSSRKKLNDLEHPSSERGVRWLGCVPSSSKVLTATNSTIRLWDLRMSVKLLDTLVTFDRIYPLAIHPDGRRYLAPLLEPAEHKLGGSPSCPEGIGCAGTHHAVRFCDMNRRRGPTSSESGEQRIPIPCRKARALKPTKKSRVPFSSTFSKAPPLPPRYADIRLSAELPTAMAISGQGRVALVTGESQYFFNSDPAKADEKHEMMPCSTGISTLAWSPCGRNLVRAGGTPATKNGKTLAVASLEVVSTWS